MSNRLSRIGIGPRIFVSSADMDSLDLIKPGGRVQYNRLIRVADPANLEAVAARIRSTVSEGQEQVETYRTAQSGIRRFLGNFLFYLNLKR